MKKKIKFYKLMNRNDEHIVDKEIHEVLIYINSRLVFGTFVDNNCQILCLVYMCPLI